MRRPDRNPPVPRNPFQRTGGLDPRIVAKQVFRLMRDDGCWQLYRDVDISEGLVRAVVALENHLASVSLIPYELHSDKKYARLPCEDGLPDLDVVISSAVSDLQQSYIERTPRLNVALLESIHNTVQEQYIKEEMQWISSMPVDEIPLPSGFLTKVRRHMEARELDKALATVRQYRSSLGPCSYWCSLQCEILESELAMHRKAFQQALDHIAKCCRTFEYLVDEVSWDTHGVAEVAKDVFINGESFTGLVDQALEACSILRNETRTGVSITEAGKIYGRLARIRKWF